MEKRVDYVELYIEKAENKNAISYYPVLHGVDAFCN